MVRRMVPFSPTAVPVLISVKYAHKRLPSVTGLFHENCPAPELAAVEPTSETEIFSLSAAAFAWDSPRLGSGAKILPQDKN